MVGRYVVAALALTTLMAGCPCLADGGPPGVGLSLEPPKERRLSPDGDHPNHLFREQTATFGLAGQSYRIAWKACVDPAHEGRVAPIEGYVGMPGPSSANWYHSGFLFIRINGRDIGTTPLSSMMAVESGPERAILDLVWRDEAANVRARFVGLPGQDCLLCEIAIEPLVEITAVGLELRCYPSYFTAWNRRDGARRIQTPAQLVEQDETVTGSLAENWWAVYYDEIFDVAKGEGSGPCSMLTVPPEGEIRFAPGSYAVTTGITLPADTTRVRLAFWDHNGVTNADALAVVSKRAAEVRALLEDADFTPAAVAGFDIAEARAEVQRALASEAAREALADQIAQMQAWLEAAEPEAGGAPGVAAEEELLRSIDTYNSFKWDVKLIELLHEL